jgi:hypothetical protein
MLLNSNRTLSLQTLEPLFYILFELRIFCALPAQSRQKRRGNHQEGFSGNQDALRLPSKKKPTQSQVK